MNLTDVKQNIIELNSEERAELMHFMVDLMEGEVFYLSDACPDVKYINPHDK